MNSPEARLMAGVNPIERLYVEIWKIKFATIKAIAPK